MYIVGTVFACNICIVTWQLPRLSERRVAQVVNDPTQILRDSGETTNSSKLAHPAPLLKHRLPLGSTVQRDGPLP
jgi:hypothetical protein